MSGIVILRYARTPCGRFFGDPARLDRAVSRCFECPILDDVQAAEAP